MIIIIKIMIVFFTYFTKIDEILGKNSGNGQQKLV